MNTYQLKSVGPESTLLNLSHFTTLGKNLDCQIVVKDEAIEDRHCRIEVKNEKVYLKDLRTKQGTWVNGTQVLEAELNDGDIIQLGQREYIFVSNKPHVINFSLTSKNLDWNKQLDFIKNMSITDHSVLLLGPSGTGKDIIAQAIHTASPRKKFPFVSVNCSALSETLIESELFGHIKGSFTGAVGDRKGAFEAARGGTLFLDEIGDLPYNLQAKLLRALENEEIRPVGSDKNIKTDVRIIAATHKNLHNKINDGSFRQDLFFRLNILAVEVPELQNRMEDFDDIFYSFAKDYRVRFSFTAIQKLKKHNWPGNIRELKNLVIRAATLFPKSFIEEQNISQLIGKTHKTYLNQNNLGISYNTENLNCQTSVIKEIEKQMIIKGLAANRGSQKMTANDLGIPRSTLHDKIKTYKIDIKAFM